ncbi:MAG: hypothetical protein ABJP89_14250 [Lentilitoribacter sp.]
MQGETIYVLKRTSFAIQSSLVAAVLEKQACRLEWHLDEGPTAETAIQQIVATRDVHIKDDGVGIWRTSWKILCIAVVSFDPCNAPGVERWCGMASPVSIWFIEYASVFSLR